MKIGDKVRVNNSMNGVITKMFEDYTTIISDKTKTILKLTKNNLIKKMKESPWNYCKRNTPWKCRKELKDGVCFYCQDKIVRKICKKKNER